MRDDGSQAGVEELKEVGIGVAAPDLDATEADTWG